MDSNIKRRVIDRVYELVNYANEIYDDYFDPTMINISFKLRGRVAGRFQAYYDTITLKFNKEMIEMNGYDKFEDTIPHEVAHYIVYMIYGGYYNGKRVKPHGNEWKEVMKDFGYSPDRTHNFVYNKNVRNVEKYTYECDCMTHEVSKIIHNRIQKGYYKGRKYSRSCKKCKSTLKRKI